MESEVEHTMYCNNAAWKETYNEIGPPVNDEKLMEEFIVRSTSYPLVPQPTTEQACIRSINKRTFFFFFNIIIKCFYVQSLCLVTVVVLQLTALCKNHLCFY